MFDKRAKADCFNLGDLVLKWDARHEDKGKHSKFDELWRALILFVLFQVGMPIFWRIQKVTE